MALLTILAIAAKPYIPPKTLLIHPAPSTISSIYGPTDINSGRVAQWIDYSANHWQCDYKKIYGNLTCGLTFSWNAMGSGGSDCSPAIGYPKCLMAASDTDGDGWGWESNQSCIVVSNGENDANNGGQATLPWPASPFCSSASMDLDGDGWGWENGQSCFVGTVGRDIKTSLFVSGSEAPSCANASTDPDGDGWGWENGQSCIVVAGVDDSNALDPQEQEIPHCSNASYDPDGDGWGWENERGCVVKRQAQGSRAEDADAIRIKAADVGQDSGCTAVGKSDDAVSVVPAYRSINFTEYDGLNVKIHYEGRARFLRLYLRNLDPADIEYRNFTSSKFMSAFLRTEDLKAGPAYVSLDEFSVDEWWILLHNPPRALAKPEFGHIVTVGVDHVDHGMHKMRIERVELTGERVSMETLLTAILLFWGGFLLVEGAIRYYMLYAASRISERQIDDLAGRAQALEEEKALLQTRAVTDALTGIFNRGGVVQQLYARFSSSNLPPGFGLMVIDIDYFKRINDMYGHNVGDQILQTLTKLISSHIRDNDIFARWGGEEFILITPHKSKERAINVAEKLRNLVANQSFDVGLEIKVTISVGVTAARANEGFKATFNRADTALYRAKSCRNTVVYEG